MKEAHAEVFFERGNAPRDLHRHHVQLTRRR
jgi:hypothetical protein